MSCSARTGGEDGIVTDAGSEADAVTMDVEGAASICTATAQSVSNPDAGTTAGGGVRDGDAKNRTSSW
jgi:hypothetical protein